MSVLEIARKRATAEARDQGITGVTYSYANRADGWYCYPHDAMGNQIGNAEYRYSKADILLYADALAAGYGVKVTRDYDPLK